MCCAVVCVWQVFLNYLANYVPGVWSQEEGCVVCGEQHQPLPKERKLWPTVLVAIEIPGPSPFLTEFLERVVSLDYPVKRMSLFLHNQVTR